MHQTEPAFGIDDRCDRAHGGRGDNAAFVRDAHVLSGTDARQIGLGNLRIEFEAVVANQTEGFPPGADHIADENPALGDSAVGGRDDAGLGHTRGEFIPAGNGRVEPGQPPYRRWNCGRRGLTD